MPPTFKELYDKGELKNYSDQPECFYWNHTDEYRASTKSYNCSLKQVWAFAMWLNKKDVLLEATDECTQTIQEDYALHQQTKYLRLATELNTLINGESMEVLDDDDDDIDFIEFVDNDIECNEL